MNIAFHSKYKSLKRKLENEAGLKRIFVCHPPICLSWNSIKVIDNTSYKLTKIILLPYFLLSRMLTLFLQRVYVECYVKNQPSSTQVGSLHGLQGKLFRHIKGNYLLQEDVSISTDGEIVETAHTKFIAF